MSIKSHVVSLELAKKLKAAGYPQSSEFWWRELKMTDSKETRLFLASELGGQTIKDADFAAPLATEIARYLPEGFRSGKNHRKHGYKRYNTHVPKFLIGEHEILTEADVRAKAWLWLKENNYLGVQ